MPTITVDSSNSQGIIKMVGNEKRIFFKRSVYSRYLFIKRVYNAEVACANYLVTKATTCSPVYKYIYIYIWYNLLVKWNLFHLCPIMSFLKRDALNSWRSVANKNTVNLISL